MQMFFDSKGMILQHWVLDKQTVNGEYYAETPKTGLCSAVQKKICILNKTVFYTSRQYKARNCTSGDVSVSKCQ
jgi:hypothetical protein